MGRGPLSPLQREPGTNRPGADDHDVTDFGHSDSKVHVSMDRFEEAVGAAIEAIPAEFQPYLDDIEFVVASRSPDGLLGRYEGSGALEAGGFPARVTIFKEGHELACDSWEKLVEEVRRTVLHEVGHHFLMEEGEMPF